MNKLYRIFFRLTAMILSLVLTAGLAACSGSSTVESDEEFQRESNSTDETMPVLRIFDKNMTGQQFDDAVAAKIMEDTGISIELVDATASPDKALEMMLINGNYPDIILMEQGTMVSQFVEAGVFRELDDLILAYGENIIEMYDGILDRSRTEDGSLYWLANWYGKDTDASAGVLMRKDYLIELVGEERANSTEPFTLSEYTDLLRQFKELHPSVDGKESIPLDIDGDAKYYDMTLKGIFGMKTYGIDDDGSLHYLPATDSYEEAVLYLNSLYSEGLLCKEWMIDKTEKWLSDLESGAVFSTWCSYWDTDDVNEELKRTDGEDAQFFCYKVVADHLDESETTYNGRNSLGWDAIGISSTCQNPEAAIKLLNYLAGEEGQYLLLWGIEGETWHLENGIHVPDETFLKKWVVNSNYMERTTGVRRWKWMIKNGNGSDGTPYDLTTKYSPSELVTFANERISETDYWDTSEYSGLEPSIRSGLGLYWQKIEAVSEDSFAKIVCASDAAEAETLYDNMVKSLQELNLQECEEAITEQYRSRQNLTDSNQNN